jgi:hypothetical protein
MRIFRRAGFWLTSLAFVAVVFSSLAIAKFVVAPAILASDRPIYLPAPPVKKAVETVARGSSAKALVVEPPIEITLTAKRRPHRERRHRPRKMPDIVIKAPKETPVFGSTTPEREPAEPDPDEEEKTDPPPVDPPSDTP